MRVETTDPWAFKWWGVATLFTISFVSLHAANYPSSPRGNGGIYLFLAFGIVFPWFLASARNYMVVPTTQFERAFCVGFDVVVRKPSFRNHMVLIGAAVGGLWFPPCYSIMLLDIINVNRNLQDTLLSIIKPAEKLTLILYTIVCTALICAWGAACLAVAPPSPPLQLRPPAAAPHHPRPFPS